MTMVYKLTDDKHQTRNGTQWGPGVTHTAPGNGPICSRAWLHAYKTPEIAAFMNPLHVGYDELVLWEADGDIGVSDRYKLGCVMLRTIKIIPLPKMTTNQRVDIAIRYVKQVCTDSAWVIWADNWLSGKDRTTAAAYAAAANANTAYAAYATAAAYAAAAVDAAATAAVDAAAVAATAAAAAAAAVAAAAVAVANTTSPLNLQSIITSTLNPQL